MYYFKCLFLALTIPYFSFFNIKSRFDQLSDNDLYERYKANTDVEIQEALAKTYLTRGKLKLDTIKIAQGYDMLARLYDYDTNIKYADSIIILTSKYKHHPNYPIIGYLLKAAYNYDKGKYKIALENYLISEQLLNSKSDFDKILTVRMGIEGIKGMWGNPIENLEHSLQTLKLLQQEKDYISLYPADYYNVLLNLSDRYLAINKIDSASHYLEKAIEYSRKNKDVRDDNYENYKKALIHYTSKDYSNSRKLFSLLSYNSLSHFQKMNYHYCLGDIAFQSNDKQTGIYHYKKVDSLYSKNTDVFPQLNRVYKFLIELAFSEGDEVKELEYIHKYMNVSDSIKDYKENIEMLLSDNYETPKLLKNLKAEIISIKNKKSYNLLLITLFILASTTSLYLIVPIIKNKYYYSYDINSEPLNLKGLTNQDSKLSLKSEDINDKPGQSISANLVDEILHKLQKFEEENLFIKLNTLKEVATYLETNSSYLSKVVNTKKEISFSQYMKNLKINYAIKAVEEKSVYKSYTIKAIAMECGFKSAESFSKAFKDKTGVYPSFYIKEMQN